MNKQDISFIMGRRLKELREERVLSHDRLKDQLKEKYGISVSRDSLMAYEISDEKRSKASKLPNMGMRAETLYFLADFYGVSLDYLLGKTDEQTTDIDVRGICEKTGLSAKSVEILSGPEYEHDFVLLLINNLIDELYAYQPAARLAARYWVQAELGDSAKGKEQMFAERILSIVGQNSALRNEDRANSFAQIPAKSAGDFYHDRAIKEICDIASKSIREFLNIYRPMIAAERNMPADLKEKADSIQKLYLLAVQAAAKDVFADEDEPI